jgi:hypothetical protein
LRRILIEAVGRAASGFRHVPHQVGPGRDLHVQETFGLLGGVGCQGGSRLLYLAPRLLRDVGDFRSGITGFCAHILGSAYSRR